MNESIKVKQRTPWLSIVGIGLVVLMTFGNAAANMIPHHVPTTHELQRAEQDDLAQQRRTRIDALLAEGDHCQFAIARELARALVLDGRSARDYADDYTRRCGDDPIVRKWADASRYVPRPIMMKR